MRTHRDSQKLSGDGLSVRRPYHVITVVAISSGDSLIWAIVEHLTAYKAQSYCY